MKTKLEADSNNMVSTLEQSEIGRRRLFVGVYLSLLAFIICLLIATLSISITVQQALIVMAALIMVNALDAFRRCLEDLKPPSKSAMFGDNYYNVYNNYKIYADTYNTYHEKQDLAKAAVEIQQLLNQLSQTYPTTTENEKMALAVEAVEEIEKNPSLKQRVVGVLKAGGIVALEEALNHPVSSIIISVLQGWITEFPEEKESKEGTNNPT